MTLAYSFAVDLVTQSAGWTLLHFMWQGALIAGLLAAGLYSLRRHSAAARYALCGVAMLLMAAVPVATFFGLAGSPTAWITHPPVKHVYGPHSVGVTTPLPSPDDPLTAAIPWLVTAWLVGVGVLLLRLAGGWIHVQRYKRKAVRTALRSEAAGGWQETVERLRKRLDIRGVVRVVESAAATVPTTIGWLRPVILMPAAVATGLTPQQLEVVIAHELAHIRRHDYLVNLLQCVMETLLFYHPGVWWVSGRMREEREYCCDDLAVAVCGNPVVYARTLTSLETLRGGVPALSLSSTGGPLMNRISRIVGLGAARPRRAAICLLPCAACGAVGVVAAAAAMFAANAEDARKLAQQQAAEAEQVELFEMSEEAPPLWSLLLEPLLEARPTVELHGQALPVLGDIPLLGHLFQSQEGELVAFDDAAELPMQHLLLEVEGAPQAEGEATERVTLAWLRAVQGELVTLEGAPAQAQGVWIAADEAPPGNEWAEGVATTAEGAATAAIQVMLAPMPLSADGTLNLECNATIETTLSRHCTVTADRTMFLDPSGNQMVLEAEEGVLWDVQPEITAERMLFMALAGDESQGTVTVQCEPGPDCPPDCEPGPNCQFGPNCPRMPGCRPSGCQAGPGVELRCIQGNVPPQWQAAPGPDSADAAAGQWVVGTHVLRNLTLRPIIVRRASAKNGEETVTLEVIAECELSSDDSEDFGPK